jgi:rhodanese-related sulfurtransferase
MYKLPCEALMSALASGEAGATSAKSYDGNAAESSARLFATAKGGAAGKGLHCIKSEDLLTMIKKSEKIVALDVRTTAESAVFGMTMPGTMNIPINEFFRPENLSRIPMDRPVVVICQTGLRAGMAVAALRQIGFDDAFALRGGYKALSDYLDPVSANSPLPAPQPLA